ncbi:hypothetical protein [Alloacidobacterium sp.]|uniref:hypothetical protein n=1 Tax=Alloacidobacterium sp. TaxID=2951999 RepID=UPI002D531664|nr:hypothetical protein [Alloacidobacterium sp.]HYK35312.1 hypothetical protein [Alloacidobacterium sp.]
MAKPHQVAPSEPEAGMPPYMESFLAHLRLLVGVPFDYLVPDARLLPDESIRFFYLDRSWTDRLVDGAIAIGKIGTREQAHHQAHASAVHQQLDQTERIVRKLQIGTFGSFSDLKGANDNNQAPGDIITGFLLRSAAVVGWPHMDVRAYDIDIPERTNGVELDPSDPNVAKHQLPTLRLELLSPSIMLALFQGIPQLVYLEEPHHGVQFGILDPQGDGNFQMFVRDTTGHQIFVPPNNPNAKTIPVPVRAANARVIHIAKLRDQLGANPAPGMPPQNGSANFALEVLQPPWRQRFEGTVDEAGQGGGDGRFVGGIMVAKNVQDATIQNAYKELLLNP